MLSESKDMQNHKIGILTHNQGFQERKLRLRWLLAISSIPLFGIFTAFGIAPQTVTEDVSVSTVIEEIALPELSSAQSLLASANQSYWQTEQIRRDETLAGLIDRLNIRNQEARDFLRNNPDASPLASQLRPGRSILAHTTETGELLELVYEVDSSNILDIKKSESGYAARLIEAELKTQSVLKSAEIRSSLFGATDDANIPDQIAIQIAEIFSSEIDFHSDLRRGDRFNVIYEAGYSNGKMVSAGKVLAVEFTNKGKTQRAVMFRTPGGQVGYFTPEGKSLHKSFLRSPLEFTRISSGFSQGRLHPILNRVRAHKGVDYAAPTGTRIKAPADATVAFVGVKTGYGNIIELQHANGVSTVYGHLSSFAKGLRKGAKVSQGDIIGAVGMTGLATGPHLHYEFRVNGQHRDPLTVALPNAAPILDKYKNAFAIESAALTSQLNLLNTSHLASLE